jgi:ribonuclease HI
MKRLHLYTDGSNREGPGTGCMAIVICTPEDEILLDTGMPIKGFGCTDDQAEYAALIQGLLKCRDEFEAEEIHCFSDNQGLINQLNGDWEVSAETRKIHYLAQKTCSCFKKVRFTQVSGTHPMMARAASLLDECLKKG